MLIQNYRVSKYNTPFFNFTKIEISLKINENYLVPNSFLLFLAYSLPQTLFRGRYFAERVHGACLHNRGVPGQSF